MGVVRREGDWRLVKRNEGVYEITYQKKPELKILTRDHDSQAIGGSLLKSTPVHQVDSYSEVEGLFEEKAHGSSPAGSGLPGLDSDSLGSAATDFESEKDTGESVDLDEVPPGLLAMILIFVGGLIVFSLDLSVGSPGFLFGVALIAGGLAIFGWGGMLCREEGIKEAATILFMVDGDSRSQNTQENTAKTPPLSQRKRDILYMDRADRRCEWCGDETDVPEIHHIKPRAEGGPNEPENLIVLCPNCHREKAEVLSRSKFRRQVRRQMKGWDGF